MKSQFKTTIGQTFYTQSDFLFIYLFIYLSIYLFIYFYF